MTKKELEKLGFIPLHTRNMYSFQTIPFSFYIQPTDTLQDIITTVYRVGIEVGIERGKEYKIEEIKTVLNINH